MKYKVKIMRNKISDISNKVTTARLKATLLYKVTLRYTMQSFWHINIIILGFHRLKRVFFFSVHASTKFIRLIISWFECYYWECVTLSLVLHVEGAAQGRGLSEHNIPAGTCSNVPLTLTVCFLNTWAQHAFQCSQHKELFSPCLIPAKEWRRGLALFYSGPQDANFKFIDTSTYTDYKACRKSPV